MDKILNKSKSMIFGRKKSKEDNTFRDSESFYDLDDYSFSSSSPRMQTQTLASKTKNPLPTKPLAQIAHYSPLGPTLAVSTNERHGFYNANPNSYSSRRDTQPIMQLRQKSLPLNRSSSISEPKPPILSLNAHASECYKLEMNFERERLASTVPSQNPIRSPSGAIQFHLAEPSTNGSDSLRGGSNDVKTGPSLRANPRQLSDTSFRGCTISTPITNKLLALETKFDPSTNRSNVQSFRTSADTVLAKHIPTLNALPTTFSSRTAVSHSENQQHNIHRMNAPSGSGLSPLRGRRSLNFFTTTNSAEANTAASSQNEKRNLSSSLLPRSTNTQGSASGFSSSSESQYGPLSNWIRYDAQNNSRNENIVSKPISSPILINHDDDSRRPFHSRAASDNHVQLNAVQPLSLRSQPRIHQKKGDEFPNGPVSKSNEKLKVETSSPSLLGQSSVLQPSASLPTPPTSTTTLSFIAGQLEMPDFDTDKGEKDRIGSPITYGCDRKSEWNKAPTSSSLTRADLETALKIQNTKINELHEQIASLREQLNDEITSKKLFGKRISHLENEIRGLRWIISEKDRDRAKCNPKGSELPVIDNESTASYGQIESEDSEPRYEASRTSHTTEKDTIEKDKDQEEYDKLKIESTTTPQRGKYSNDLNVTLRTIPNRRKRFGLALDLSPDSTPIGSASLRKVQIHTDNSSTPSQKWGNKV